VTDPAALDSLVKRLNAAACITFDVETTSTDPMRADLVGIALCMKEGEGYYLPVGHNAEAGSQSVQAGGQSPTSNSQLPLATVLDALKRPLTNARIPKYGHNLKYDFTVLARLGVRVAPLAFDTMLAEWLSDPGSHSLGLKKLAFIRLGIEMTEISELLGTGKKQITMDRVPVAQAAPYAAADVDMTTRLVPLLKQELEEKLQLNLFNTLEMPLVSVLADMEMAGVSLDTGHLAEMSRDLEKQLARIEKAIFKLVGHEFNINSTQQLSQALYDKLQLRPGDARRKTAAGKFSTAADVLEEMRGQHPVIELILEQRELSKLKSTYVDALPLAVNPATGRVHTSYNQAGSVTGRIASSEPNLQNIPIRTELGRRVRQAFVAARGRRLISADYSQIELRVVAHMARDEALLSAFRRGEDIHTVTASAVLNIPPAKLTKEQRRIAKTVNFGVLYGQGAFGLTRTTGMTLAEAEDFIRNYFERFPGVKRYLDETKRLAAERGYVETLLGRRRYFPILQRPGSTREDAIARSRAEREAINAPVQGTAADIIRRAMLRLPEALAKKTLTARMLLQVHDELVFECPTDEVAATARVVREVMEAAFKLDIPLGVEVRSGKNWEEMKPVA
jgi:DNA polymerase-1